MGAQIAEVGALVDAVQEVLEREMLFQIERAEQPLLSTGNCPIMLPAPSLAEGMILPAAWSGSYF
ncbi:TPA: hypothetical protein OT881_005810, partial [Pseudomonas aeruginosa]|nr:hypothetical protein [Pseudomonas aeruginosa]